MRINPAFSQIPFAGMAKAVPTPKFGMEIRERAIDSLALAEEYTPLIKSGQKKSTVRLGYNFPTKSQLTIQPNDGSTPFKVAVTGLEIKKYGELTDEHARMDGFVSLQGLQQALKKFYGDIPADYPMSIIHFAY